MCTVSAQNSYNLASIVLDQPKQAASPAQIQRVGKQTLTLSGMNFRVTNAMGSGGDGHLWPFVPSATEQSSDVINTGLKDGVLRGCGVSLGSPSTPVLPSLPGGGSLLTVCVSSIADWVSASQPGTAARISLLFSPAVKL